MSGYWSLHATRLPSGSVARCTGPSGAAAAASCSNAAKRRSHAGPSSLAMRRLTNGQPIGGAFDCSWISSETYSFGSASGMVESSCATFISGPLRPPSAAVSSRAWRARSIDMPNTRSAPSLAAKPPAAAPPRAHRGTRPPREFSSSSVAITARSRERLDLVDELGDQRQAALPEAGIARIEAEGLEQLVVALGAAGAQHVEILLREPGRRAAIGGVE